MCNKSEKICVVVRGLILCDEEICCAFKFVKKKCIVYVKRCVLYLLRDNVMIVEEMCIVWTMSVYGIKEEFVQILTFDCWFQCCFLLKHEDCKEQLRVCLWLSVLLLFLLGNTCFFNPLIFVFSLTFYYFYFNLNFFHTWNDPEDFKKFCK